MLYWLHLHRQSGRQVDLQIGFEILPGTAGSAGEVDLNPYAIADDSIQVSGE